MAVWDVTTRPAREQFGFWREVICEAFVPLTPTRRGDVTDGFSSRVETRPLPRVVRARIASQPQRTAHGRSEVARTDGEYVFVNVQTAGTCAVEQRGRRSVVRPGQFTVVDTASPYHFEFDEPWGMVSYRVPYALLGGRLDAVLRSSGGCWDPTGAGAVVTAVMASMWDLDTGGDAALDVEAALASALSAAVAEHDDPPADRHAALRAELERRMERWLPDSSLSVRSASRELGVSARTLHAAVGAGGTTTFAALVRRRRLERAAALLAGGAPHATVTEIAASVGFDGPASFSRAFRREFGCTPSEVRRSGRTPARTAQPPRTR